MHQFVTATTATTITTTANAKYLHFTICTNSMSQVGRGQNEERGKALILTL